MPKDQQFQAVQAAILLLPKENREALKILLFFLRDVVAFVEENQMTPTNIAVCLAPSLFHLNTLRRDSSSSSTRYCHLGAGSAAVHSALAGAVLSVAGLGSVSDFEGEVGCVCLGVCLQSGCSGAAGAACSAWSDVATHCPVQRALVRPHCLCMSPITAALPCLPRSPACGPLLALKWCWPLEMCSCTGNLSPAEALRPCRYLAD